jgi:hypothetical protein
MLTTLEMPNLKLVSLPASDSRHRSATHRHADALGGAREGPDDARTAPGMSPLIPARAILGIKSARADTTWRI